MKKGILKTIAVCAALAMTAGTAFASDDGVKLTEEVKQQIRTSLIEQGYEVGKIKTEDGLYEAYARKDGQRYEVFLNAKLEIVKTEIDD